MADSKAHHTATEMDYPAHERNYAGFVNLLKYGTVAAALIAAFVVYAISN